MKSINWYLYEQEEKFYNFVASRSVSDIERKVKMLNCPIICIDGTTAIADNVQTILREAENEQYFNS